MFFLMSLYGIGSVSRTTQAKQSSILTKKEFVEAAKAKDFDLRFYRMPIGDDYALRQECMVTLEEFRKLIK